MAGSTTSLDALASNFTSPAGLDVRGRASPAALAPRIPGPAQPRSWASVPEGRSSPDSRFGEETFILNPMMISQGKKTTQECGLGPPNSCAGRQRSPLPAHGAASHPAVARAAADGEESGPRSPRWPGAAACPTPGAPGPPASGTQSGRILTQPPPRPGPCPAHTRSWGAAAERRRRDSNPPMSSGRGGRAGAAGWAGCKERTASLQPGGGS